MLSNCGDFPLASRFVDTEFKTSKSSAVLVWLFFAALVGLGLAFFLPDQLPHSIGFNQRRLITGVLIAVVAVVMFYFMVVRANSTIRVTPQAVEQYRGRRLTASWPRATTHFHTEVVQQRYNGVKTNVLRYLVVDPAGSTTKLAIPANRRKFNQLYADLEPLDVVTAQGRTWSTATMHDHSGRPRPPRGAELAAVSAPPTHLPPPSAELRDTGALPPPLPTPSAPAATVSSFAPKRDWAGGKGRGIPEQIEVTPMGVIVDGERFDYQDLHLIELSPPGYDRREMSISRRDGKARSWKMGRSGGDLAAAPNGDYEALLVALLRATIASYPSLVQLDMG